MSFFVVLFLFIYFLILFVKLFKLMTFIRKIQGNEGLNLEYDNPQEEIEKRIKETRNSFVRFIVVVIIGVFLIAFLNSI